MPSSESNKIVIRLPRLEWGLLLKRRVLGGLMVLCLLGGVGFWWVAVRPYLWVTEAHVEAYTVSLKSDANGRIVEMGPREGDWVKEGDPLCLFNSGELFYQMLQAKERIENLQQKLEKENGRLGKAMEGYVAATQGFEFGVADEVKKQLSFMEEAQENVEKMSAELGEAKREFERLNGEVRQRALCAPFRGKVLKRSQNPGAVVTFGDPIYVLSDPGRMWVEAELPESKMGAVSTGSAVRVRFPAYPGKEWAGKVGEIGAATVEKEALLPFSGQEQRVRVKIYLEKGGIDLKPGLSAAVQFKVH